MGVNVVQNHYPELPAPHHDPRNWAPKPSRSGTNTESDKVRRELGEFSGTSRGSDGVGTREMIYKVTRYLDNSFASQAKHPKPRYRQLSSEQKCPVNVISSTSSRRDCRQSFSNDPTRTAGIYVSVHPSFLPYCHQSGSVLQCFHKLDSCDCLCTQGSHPQGKADIDKL